DVERGAEVVLFLFFQAEHGIRVYKVTGVQTCALPIFHAVSKRFTNIAILDVLNTRLRIRRAGRCGARGKSRHTSPSRFRRTRSRSEERRVGKEGRSRGGATHQQLAEQGCPGVAKLAFE